MMIKEKDTGKKASRTKRTGPLQHQWLRGETITRGSITVTPISRRVTLGLPRWMRPDKGWVLICQRPVALIVTRGESTQTIPIHDLQQIVIFVMITLTTLSLYILSRPKRSKCAMQGENQ